MEENRIRKKVFISHINEESTLAVPLKKWIESSFAGQCDVFVSSDSDDIPAGSKWFQEIDNALGEALVLIVLCSAASLARPWINFEMGYVWNKGVPILPICHSGQKKGALPPPISMFQALELEDEGFVTDLLSSLAKHLQFSKIPPIDQHSMRQGLLAASAAKAEVVPVPKQAPEVTEEEIPPEALEILTLLGQVSDREPTANELAALFKMPEQRMEYFLDLLDGRNLLYRAISLTGPTRYSLRSGGRKYLFARGLL